MAPSITTPIPGIVDGKPADVRCVQLTPEARCAIFGQPARPACCSGLQPRADLCGVEPADALRLQRWLEAATRPVPGARATRRAADGSGPPATP